MAGLKPRPSRAMRAGRGLLGLATPTRRRLQGGARTASEVRRDSRDLEERAARGISFGTAEAVP